MSIDERLSLPPLRNVRSFISQTGNTAGTAPPTSDATTAVTLQTADQAEMSTAEQDQKGHSLAPQILHAPSVTESFSPYMYSVDSSDNDDLPELIHGGLQLPEILNDLMLASGRQSGELPSILGYNLFTEDDAVFDSEFMQKSVLFSKLERQFKDKLKQFFVLSAAGKPIYSLNGNDGVLLGYMGLITTIIGSFQEGMKREIHSISLPLHRIVVKVKGPMYLVAITKIPHEISDSSSLELSILENQLECLYSYVIAVLSKTVITKHFEQGMNYDLRRILTVQDFHALDTLAMKLTYGFHSVGGGSVEIDASYCLGSVLGNAMRCVRISNTSRTKLNEILLSAKRLRAPKSTDFVSSISSRFTATDESASLSTDLLFGFMTLEDRVLTCIRPKNHKLQSRDISTLLFTVNLSLVSLPEDENAELWIPLCMAQFNSSGFLYCYAKKFGVQRCERKMTLILVSGNKNSFYSMKEAANHIISRVHRSGTLMNKLGWEISKFNGKQSILSELQVSSITHFIYRHKVHNQIFMEGTAKRTETSDLKSLQSSLQTIALYSNLIASRGYSHGSKRVRSKKLTYHRLNLNDTLITGFLLTDEKYEFYCLCEGSVSSQTIIQESLRIIKWCERQKKRLFVGDGVSF